MKKNILCLFALIAALSITHISQAAIVEVCGTDTITLSAGNYQYGTIQWQESPDLNNWTNIPNAQETTYKFLPDETKYYRAKVVYSDCAPEYSDVSLVQLPPVADAGANRVVPGNTVALTANTETAATGIWSIINGTGGLFSSINDPKAQFQGNDTLYVLIYSLSNACGTSKDTIEVRFKQNTYISNLVVVDTTDLLLSDSTQLAQGEYEITFSSPVPIITDSSILVGIINDGFLRRVTSFTVVGNTFTMQTTQATLEDIIIDGAVNVAQTFGVDTTVGKKPDPHRLDHKPTRLELNTDPKFQTGEVFYYTPGETVEYIRDGITLNKKMMGASSHLIDVNFNSALSLGGVSYQLNGYYRFEPNIIADMDFSGLTLNTANIGMYNGIIERNYQLTLSASSTASFLDQSFTLLSISKPIIMVIGVVPVYINAKLELKGKASANIAASMSFVHDYTKTSTHNANIAYSNNQWTYNYNETSQMQTGNSSSITGNLAQDFEIGPELTFKIYGIVGPYVKAGLTEDLNLCTDFSANWNASMDIGGHISVGAKAKVASWTIFDVYKTWAQDFYTIQLPYNIAIESGNNQNYTTGNTLPEEVKVKVTANRGFSVPGATVQFNPLDGGSVAAATVITSNNGIAATTWTPGGSAQSGLEASILDCYGNQLNNSPLVFNAYETQNVNCLQSSLSVSITQNGNIISPLAHNGVSPYTYSTDGINFSSVVPQITPSAGMTYTFTVKDNNGCTAAESYNEPLTDACANSDLSINVQVSSNTVTATAQGGAPPYLYAIDDTTVFSSNNVFNNVSIGGHIVYVKDVDACVASIGIAVTDTTQPGGGSTMTDPRDGQVYNIVKIGNQWWMAENLNYGTYAALTSPQVAGTKFCQNLSGANDPACPMGGLYEWDNLMNGEASSNSVPSGVQGLCPPGWHLPSDAEWCNLENAIEAGTDAGCSLTGYRGTNTGGDMKVTPICGGLPCWYSPNTGATNSSGFSALPGGHSWSGSFGNAGIFGFWWSSTESGGNAWRRLLHYTEARVYRATYIKAYGFSCRCVKD